MLDENITHILTYIGALTCLFLALCMTCTIAFVVFLVLDGEQARRKHKNGKHQSAGELLHIPGIEDVEFFEKLGAKETAEERFAQEAMKNNPNDATRVHIPLKAVPGWEQEELDGRDATIVQQPFNLEGPGLDYRRPRH